ncbi:hypothetical protein POJ06DRAFT_142876 [Lipomyces tetrasporus]|uniref:Uncharacterized protein n=1 Tax=Lipomyces tetrasporus TaxID=54092 RepID=A0AAD7QNX5_9ASCO|nr:uncharacterized protein POJ06DRAFT_142876 [Lipomyces tetrasporus]KAJ8098825.1 hypothetical protein POJ06DRAFT_142876 [Lipomyces tetrasporus]
MDYKVSQFQSRRSHGNGQQSLLPLTSQPQLQHLIHHDQDISQGPTSTHSLYLPPGSDPTIIDSPRSRSREFRNYSPMHNVSSIAPQLTPPSYSSMSTSPYASGSPAASGYSPSTGNPVPLPPTYRSQYGTTTPVQYSPTQYYSQLNLSPLHSTINQGPAYHLTQLGASPGRGSLGMLTI